jgi:hypothetical protein
VRAQSSAGDRQAETQRILKQEARRSYDGNVSALVSAIAKEAKRQSALDWLLQRSENTPMTDAETSKRHLRLSRCGDCTTMRSTMAPRAGITKKVSLSVNQEDLAILKHRARRLYGGNVSAVFADLIARLKRQEAWARAVAWYGKPVVMTDEERAQVDRELLGDAPRKKASRRKSAA